jgi:hypothetical protein
MKAFRVILLLSLALIGADAFTTKKREKRPAFQSADVFKESKEAKEEQMAPSATSHGPTAMFALPPTTMAAAIPMMHQDEAEDEVDVSYGVAMVTCVLSLALGFGLGYGT